VLAPLKKMRVLVLATTTGYQTRSFGEAAERLGVELVFATDRCDMIDDPWRDGAVPIRFYDEDRSVASIVELARVRPIDGILVVGDRPTVIAARAAQALGLPGHPPEAAAIARNKEMMRTRLRDAGLPVPWFIRSAIDHEPSAISHQPLSYPCVVKPVALSGSRGVMRADDPAAFATAFERLRALLRSPEVRSERNDANETVLIESFIPGREYAVEAILQHGVLHVLAIFDKPDPLDGPFFEETIYVTPSASSRDVQNAIVHGVTAAATAIGLYHGPIHAECRVHPSTGDVFVLEVAARPIGGLCARVLRGLEELLLRHALGDVSDWPAAASASGVMMIPIPRRGYLRSVDGVDAAKAVPQIEDVRITAKPDQLLVPLPEGASYLGFIFARASDASAVERALREAHARLAFVIDTELPVLAASQTRYNHRHG
jgi:formate-dependent phosphoribosylglycinamide formyltransferase (GAR transformylase)